MACINLTCLLLLILFECFARDPPTITIPNQGTIVGKEISMIRTQRILGFLAIPYAHPPVQSLRFAPPFTEPPPSWDGVRNATEYAPACLQTTRDYKSQDLPFLNLISNLTFEINEDCLYLNVFVPYGTPPPDGFTTIIWFHPGNFTTGNPAIWNPYTLVFKQRVIVVTISWRLNIMGFFTTTDGVAPGNFGLMDQQAAMIWVKNNIKLFGGNPDNICLMGYGTGAMSVGLHMINSQSSKLFSKAISMSGSFLHPSSVRDPREDKVVLDNIAELFACFRTPTDALIECLRRIRADELVSLTSNINWRPLIDKDLSNTSAPFLTEHPKAYFERGEFYKVPFLTGYTNMEEVLGMQNLDPDEEISEEFVTSMLSEITNRDISSTVDNSSCMHNQITDSVLFFYGPTKPIKSADKARKIISDFSTEKNYGASTYLHARFVSKYQPTYVYRFDMKPSTPAATAGIPEWISVPHLFDLIYVWGVPYWTQLPDQQEWDTRDKSTSDIIMSFWTNFAKSSNPTENSIYPIRWDPFTTDDPAILIIDRTFNMSDETRLNYKAFEFWNEYYPKVVEMSKRCCNTTDVAPISYVHYVYLYVLCFISAIFTFQPIVQ